MEIRAPDGLRGGVAAHRRASGARIHPFGLDHQSLGRIEATDSRPSPNKRVMCPLGLFLALCMEAQWTCRVNDACMSRAFGGIFQVCYSNSVVSEGYTNA